MKHVAEKGEPKREKRRNPKLTPLERRRLEQRQRANMKRKE